MGLSALGIAVWIQIPYSWGALYDSSRYRIAGGLCMTHPDTVSWGALYVIQIPYSCGALYDSSRYRIAGELCMTTV